LELHCRQKAPGVQSAGTSGSVVAGLQQDSYTQVIHKNWGQQQGQVVGDLWTAGGAKEIIPHGGLGHHAYAANPNSCAFILSKNVHSSAKC
jgi:hypothetical protein